MELTKEYFDEKINSLVSNLNQNFTSIDLKFKKIDQRFEHIDQRFEHIDQRFEKIDQQFSEVNANIVNLQASFTELRNDMPTREDYNRLQRSVDSFAKYYRDKDDTITILQYHDEQTRKWIRKAASKIGVEFSET